MNMKVFKSFLGVALLALVAGCHPDEIDINTAPVFLESFVVDGTDTDTGEAVSKRVGDNETAVPVDGVFTLTFSKAVTAESASAVALTLEGTAVPASVTATDAAIIIDPNEDLEFGKTYTITVNTNVKAEDGGMFIKDVARSFSTEVPAPAYVPVYGEVFYMPFDGSFIDLVSGTQATVVGDPGFAGEGVAGGNAYAGSVDSYLTFPAAGLTSQEFSASFWYKLNADPNRAGILVMGPPDPNLPETPNNRTAGFRFFREDAAGMQRFNLNVGNGTSDSWSAAGDLDPAADEWVHYAFTISGSQIVVYRNGVKMSSVDDFAGISWEGVDILSIMSGAPRFTEWGHLSDQSYLDELRFFDRVLTPEEITTIMNADMGGGGGYTPMDGETLYMPFDGTYTDLVSGTDATVVGSPGFAGESVKGSDAYAGAADSYLTFPSDALESTEFSAAFWLKINAVPDRAGILVMSPPDDVNPAKPNNRTAGLRFFRENIGGMQRFKLNMGTGTGDAYVDGAEAADVDPATGEWVHFAFTISATEGIVYINGEVVKQAAFSGISWDGVESLSIMSGAPRFVEWGHLSDQSFMDELHLFNKVLTQEEVRALMGN